MKKSRIQKLNNIYLLFLIIVLIILSFISYVTGKKIYYLVNTNLNHENVPVNSNTANWNFEVRIEY